MPLSLRYAAGSHVGLVRDGNEDAGYAGPGLLAVADGMGGHVAGEVASGIAVVTAAEQDLATNPATTPSGEFGESEAESARQQARAQLENIVTQANERIRHRVENDHNLRGMGCTLTVLVRVKDQTQFGLAHVGDSRCYRLREGQLEQITVDHTFVQALVDEGRITASQAAVHPQRSLITRALDGREDVEADISFFPLVAQDRYLLCSDGLSGVVNFANLQEVLLNEPDPSEACEELIARALEGGGPDNITCVIADVVENPVRKNTPVWVGAADAGRGDKSLAQNTDPLPKLNPTDDHDSESESPTPSSKRSLGQGYCNLVGHLKAVHNPHDLVDDEQLKPVATTSPISGPRVGTVDRPSANSPAVALSGDVPPVTSLRSRFTYREQESAWPWWVLGIAFVCALVFLAASLAYSNSQHRFYIGVRSVDTVPAQSGVIDGDALQNDEQVVAIYQGVNRELPLLTLSRLNETTDLTLNSLPPVTRERVRSTIPARDAAEAQQILQDLRQTAQLCKPWADEQDPASQQTRTPEATASPGLPAPQPSATTISERPPECAGMGSQS